MCLFSWSLIIDTYNDCLVCKQLLSMLYEKIVNGAYDALCFVVVFCDAGGA